MSDHRIAFDLAKRVEHRFRDQVVHALHRSRSGFAGNRQALRPELCGQEPPAGCVTVGAWAEEVAALEADPDDRALLRDVADTMEDLRAPW